MDPKFSNPKVVAEQGEQIYRELYQAQYEPRHSGKFVAIDVTTKLAYMGETAEGAYQAARGQAPEGVFHLIKVGAPGAFRVSYGRNATTDWVFQ